MALMSQPSKLLAKFLMAWVREPGGVDQRLRVSGVVTPPRGLLCLGTHKAVSYGAPGMETRDTCPAPSIA